MEAKILKIEKCTKIVDKQNLIFALITIKVKKQIFTIEKDINKIENFDLINFVKKLRLFQSITKIEREKILNEIQKNPIINIVSEPIKKIDNYLNY